MKLFDGLLRLRRLPGLSTGEVGGFETARVVFALGLVLFVRGLGVRGARGVRVGKLLGLEPGEDFFDERGLVHGLTNPSIDTMHVVVIV